MALWLCPICLQNMLLHPCNNSTLDIVILHRPSQTKLAMSHPMQATHTVTRNHSPQS